jgi:hypothetical protein
MEMPKIQGQCNCRRNEASNAAAKFDGVVDEGILRELDLHLLKVTLHVGLRLSCHICVLADRGYTKEFSGIIDDRIFNAGQETVDHATHAARTNFLTDFVDVAATHGHIDVLAVFVFKGVLAHCASSSVDSTFHARRYLAISVKDTILVLG